MLHEVKESIGVMLVVLEEHWRTALCFVLITCVVIFLWLASDERIHNYVVSHHV